LLIFRFFLSCVFSSEDEFEDGMDPEIQQAFEEFMNGT